MLNASYITVSKLQLASLATPSVTWYSFSFPWKSSVVKALTLNHHLTVAEHFLTGGRGKGGGGNCPFYSKFWPKLLGLATNFLSSGPNSTYNLKSCPNTFVKLMKALHGISTKSFAKFMDRMQRRPPFVEWTNLMNQNSTLSLKKQTYYCTALFLDDEDNSS